MYIFAPYRESFWVNAYIGEKEYHVLIYHLCSQPKAAVIPIYFLLDDRNYIAKVSDVAIIGRPVSVHPK